jgi:hypothetical protein
VQGDDGSAYLDEKETQVLLLAKQVEANDAQTCGKQLRLRNMIRVLYSLHAYVCYHINLEHQAISPHLPVAANLLIGDHVLHHLLASGSSTSQVMIYRPQEES